MTVAQFGRRPLASRWATEPNHSRYYDGRGWRNGDRDHDGVPDYRDRQPDNPRRY